MSKKFGILLLVLLTLLLAVYFNNYSKLSTLSDALGEPIFISSPSIVATITSTPIRNPEQTENDRLECLRKGGDWQGRPFGRGYFCNIPQADSGKSCTDGVQCMSGNCIADESSNGGCSKYSVLYGCYTFLGKSPYQANLRGSKIETNQVCID